MKKIKYIFSFLLLVTASMSFAQQGYTVLAPLPGIQGQPTISTYIPAAINLAITVGAILAFIMITFGGIMYATSDAISGKQKGKDYVTNAIYGLLLVIGAWVIMNTINPDTVKLNLTLSKPDIGTGGGGVGPGGGTGGLIDPGTPPCTNCVLIKNVNSNIQTDPNTFVTSTLATKLATACAINCTFWYVTEGYIEEQGPHTSTSCHFSGSCADIGLAVKGTGNTAASAINTVYGALSQSGMSRISLEIKTQSEANELLKNGLSRNIRLCVSYNVDGTRNPSCPGTTGTHFHVLQ